MGPRLSLPKVLRHEPLQHRDGIARFFCSGSLIDRSELKALHYIPRDETYSKSRRFPRQSAAFYLVGYIKLSE